MTITVSFSRPPLFDAFPAQGDAWHMMCSETGMVVKVDKDGYGTHLFTAAIPSGVLYGHVEVVDQQRVDTYVRSFVDSEGYAPQQNMLDHMFSTDPDMQRRKAEMIEWWNANLDNITQTIRP